MVLDMFRFELFDYTTILNTPSCVFCVSVGLNLFHPEHHNRCVLKRSRSLHRKFQELRICVFKFKTFFTRAVDGEEVLEIVLF